MVVIDTDLKEGQTMLVTNIKGVLYGKVDATNKMTQDNILKIKDRLWFSLARILDYDVDKLVKEW